MSTAVSGEPLVVEGHSTKVFGGSVNRLFVTCFSITIFKDFLTSSDLEYIVYCFCKEYVEYCMWFKREKINSLDKQQIKLIF